MKSRVVICNQLGRAERTERKLGLYACSGAILQTTTYTHQLLSCNNWTKQHLHLENMKLSGIGERVFAALAQLSAALDDVVEHGAMAIYARPDRLACDKHKIVSSVASGKQHGATIGFV